MHTSRARSGPREADRMGGACAVALATLVRAAGVDRPVLGRCGAAGGLAPGRIKVNLESGVVRHRRGEPPANPVIARPAVGEPDAGVRRAGEAPAEALDAAPTVASSRMGTLTVFPDSPPATTSVPEVAVWPSPAVRARVVHRHLHRCRAVEAHREAEVFVPSLARP